MPLAQQFASLFAGAQARRALRRLLPRGHTRLSTFNLTTTSLRYLTRWFDRLQIIARGHAGGHGNFYSDPAAIGLVNSIVRPPTLTQAGQAFLAKRAALYRDPARAEYELVKILYSGAHAHTEGARRFLEAKREHLFRVLDLFGPTAKRDVFLSHPNLLVIAELVANFPGALPRLRNLSRQELLELSSLGEGRFARLCSGPGFPQGLERLCRRIGSDYTRGEDRRLHYVVSMALLEIARSTPARRPIKLKVPLPYLNLLTESDIYRLHARYTSDISVWFDGVDFQVSKSLGAPVVVLRAEGGALETVVLSPEAGVPGGRGQASATHASRKRRRRTGHAQTTVIVDQVLSARAEDYTEEILLRPQYGPRLVRVGHTDGETISLLDGMVPGADFYVVDEDELPVEFVEIKSISGRPPAEISLTRAEYLRARRCVEEEIPYRLLLVDVASGRSWEVENFAASIAGTTLEQVRQFVVQVRAPGGAT